jgi:SAM-dependent methyltransferase
MMPKTEREDQSRSDPFTNFLEPLRSGGFKRFPGRGMLKLLLSEIADSASDPRGLHTPLISAISLQPELTEFLKSIDVRGDLEIIETCQKLIFLESRGIDIVHLILRRQINTDPAMEHALASLRRAYLRSVVRQPEAIAPRLFPSMITIALQCFNNEYVFCETSEEVEICREIAAGQWGDDCGVSSLVLKVIAYGMYRPISQLALSEQQIHSLKQQGEDVQELIDRQIRENALERELAAHISSFGRIQDEVSIKVRRQYEEAPYPRWIDLAERKPRQFAAYIGKKFPFLREGLPMGSVDCLVAGCGTGQHSLYVASKFSAATVTAVDISRRSLAYGMRQASRYGFGNIEFLHGDLLEIKALKRDFDLIESVGVLHHLEDPLSGFKALTEVLRPGGFMKIAVYRRSFRNQLMPAKEFVRAHMKSYAATDLRGVRHELIADKSVNLCCTGSSDFYYLSGFRDLLCHVQETSFTPSEIKVMLRKLDLEFLGMEYSDRAIKTAFQAAYPDKSRAYDLDVYEEFEAGRAEQMPSLLEFWVRKKR